MSFLSVIFKAILPLYVAITTGGESKVLYSGTLANKDSQYVKFIIHAWSGPKLTIFEGSFHTKKYAGIVYMYGSNIEMVDYEVANLSVGVLPTSAGYNIVVVGTPGYTVEWKMIKLELLTSNT